MDEFTDDEVVAAIQEALRWADRRDRLCRRAPRCPECSAAQVQLTDHFAAPAEWRCRECGHAFVHEPPEEETPEARLDRIAALGRGWDGHGGAAPTPAAVAAARVMLRQPFLVPMSDGGIQLEWHRDGRDIEVVVRPDGSVEEDAGPLGPDTARLLHRLASGGTGREELGVLLEDFRLAEVAEAERRGEVVVGYGARAEVWLSDAFNAAVEDACRHIDADLDLDNWRRG